MIFVPILYNPRDQMKGFYSISNQQDYQAEFVMTIMSVWGDNT